MTDTASTSASAERYVVIGNPIAHSQSPSIHARFAAQTAQDLVYERLLAPLEGFPQVVADFRAAGGRGANVTAPFKEQAWRLCEHYSAAAASARAVNTLQFDAAGIYGDNTDGAGLVHDLRDNNGVTIRGKRVAILGAGGAVRGIVPALLAEQPECLHIANRTPKRATELAAEQGDPDITGGGFELLEAGPYDIVVNAVSASRDSGLPPLPRTLLAEHAACYDLIYAHELTAFVRWAREHGATVALDGLGMLVEQAAAAFYLWRGVCPNTAPVIDALRRD